MKSVRILVLIAAALVRTSLAHWALHYPPARNICNPDPRWPRSAGSGQGSGDLNGRPPPCGDPFIETQGNDGDSTYFQPTYECEPEVLQAGSMLTTDLTVYGHHGGFGRCAINVNRYAEEWNEADFIQLITTDQDPNGSDRYYFLDDYVLTDGGQWNYPVTWQLPAGVTTEHGILSCEFVTAHRCAPARGCDPTICGMYSLGENTWGWPDDPFRNDGACNNPLNPAPGDGPQIFRNCADITLVGDGTTTPTPLPGTPETPPAPAPAPVTATTTPPVTPAQSPEPAPVPEEMPAEEPFVEESDPPMHILTPQVNPPMGVPSVPTVNPPTDGPPMNMGPGAHPPMGEELPPMEHAVLFALAIVDLGNEFETMFEHMSGVTITVADYPNGFGIRALVEDSSEVQTVDFTTSDGYAHTELQEPYNMFTRRAGYAWPDPPIGSTVTLDVLATMLDGSTTDIHTSITFA